MHAKKPIDISISICPEEWKCDDGPAYGPRRSSAETGPCCGNSCTWQGNLSTPSPSSCTGLTTLTREINLHCSLSVASFLIPRFRTRLHRVRVSIFEDICGQCVADQCRLIYRQNCLARHYDFEERFSLSTPWTSPSQISPSFSQLHFPQSSAQFLKKAIENMNGDLKPSMEMEAMGIKHNNDENDMARLGKVPVLKVCNSSDVLGPLSI